MIEFLQFSFAPVHLPLTALLAVVFLYWIAYLIGGVTLDLFDGEIDGGADGDLSSGSELSSADADGAEGLENGHPSGVWHTVLEFLHVGDVPMTILLSVFVGTLWTIMLTSQYYLNRELAPGRSLGLFLFSICGGLLATKCITYPLRKFFRTLGDEFEVPLQIVGKTCIVTTSEVTSRFGQARIDHAASPILLNVRCQSGAPLAKGSEAVVTGHDAANNVYFVVPIDWENHS